MRVAPQGSEFAQFLSRIRKIRATIAAHSGRRYVDAFGRTVAAKVSELKSHLSGIDIVTAENVDAYLAQWRGWESGATDEYR